jgi:hypothetical protein
MRNPALRSRCFKFALNHSMNALGSKAKRGKDAPIPMEWVFDWLMDVARDFITPGACRVRVRENMLWVTKKIVINLDFSPPHNRSG